MLEGEPWGPWGHGVGQVEKIAEQESAVESRRLMEAEAAPLTQEEGELGPRAFPSPTNPPARAARHGRAGQPLRGDAAVA